MCLNEECILWWYFHGKLTHILQLGSRLSLIYINECYLEFSVLKMIRTTTYTLKGVYTIYCWKQTAEVQQLIIGEKRFAEVAENRHSFGLDQWQVDEIIV